MSPSLIYCISWTSWGMLGKSEGNALLMEVLHVVGLVWGSKERWGCYVVGDVQPHIENVAMALSVCLYIGVAALSPTPLHSGQTITPVPLHVRHFPPFPPFAASQRHGDQQLHLQQHAQCIIASAACDTALTRKPSSSPRHCTARGAVQLQRAAGILRGAADVHTGAGVGHTAAFIKQHALLAGQYARDRTQPRMAGCG